MKENTYMMQFVFYFVIPYDLKRKKYVNGKFHDENISSSKIDELT